MGLTCPKCECQCESNDCEKCEVCDKCKTCEKCKDCGPQKKCFYLNFDEEWEEKDMCYGECKRRDSCFDGGGKVDGGCYKWTVKNGDAFTSWGSSVSADEKTNEQSEYVTSVLRRR